MLTDLTTYKRGAPMTMGQLRALPDGAVVFAADLEDDGENESAAGDEYTAIFHAVSER